MPDIDPAYLPWQTNILQRALDLKSEQRLPHAVMIDSASDQDMSSLIWHLSMLLLCDEPRQLSPCGHCEACRMMQADTYSDFSLVTLIPDDKTKKMSKNIKIEQVRNLIHEVSLTHQYERLKIVVIYPAEAMNKASANALLKTLEEPAARVLIVLLTHNRGRIPITLRSRCQSWSINPPTREQALEWLEARGLAGQDGERYLDYANGDPVRAQSLRQQDYASLVEQFKSRFSLFLRAELSVSGLCQELLSSETGLVKRLVAMTLDAYCYHSSGVDSDANPKNGADRSRAQLLLDLRQRAQNQLRVEENNLDFQLQLEDVLISLKQILTRRTI
jgi:DNA polymerase-3 subunit delta'